MAKNCCDAADVGDVHNDPRWRKVLWVALGLNAIMFAVEIVAGIAADSRALQAGARGAREGGDHAGLWSLGPGLGDLGPLRRRISGCRNDGHRRFPGARSKSRGRGDALSVSNRGREYALGMDLFAQRRDRKRRGASGRGRCFRDGGGMA